MKLKMELYNPYQNFLDTDFTIEGWKFRNTISETKRSKEEIYIDKNFRKKLT